MIKRQIYDFHILSLTNKDNGINWLQQKKYKNKGGFNGKGNNNKEDLTMTVCTDGC